MGAEPWNRCASRGNRDHCLVLFTQTSRPWKLVLKCGKQKTTRRGVTMYLAMDRDGNARRPQVLARMQRVGDTWPLPVRAGLGHGWCRPATLETPWLRAGIPFAEGEPGSCAPGGRSQRVRAAPPERKCPPRANAGQRAANETPSHTYTHVNE